MQKRFGFCTLFKGYIPNAKKSAKNPLRFAPKVSKWKRHEKMPVIFLRFHFCTWTLFAYIQNW